jgi:hypothetical protein
MKKIFIIIIATLLPLMASAGLSDQLFYIYDSSTKTATLTRNQDWACYTGHIIIPSKVTYNNVEYIVTAIGAYALEGSREWDASPSSVTIPSSVKVLGNEVFNDCKNLTAITLPDGLKKIGSHAFEGCTTLKEMIIPNLVNNIGTSAFEECTSLDSVAINGLITEITNDMFRNCSSLRSITIPNTVRKILIPPGEVTEKAVRLLLPFRAGGTCKCVQNARPVYSASAEGVAQPENNFVSGDPIVFHGQIHQIS